MISINKIETFGFEAAIRGCRNPMNSWDKSDSKFYNVDNLCVEDWHLIGTFNIGPNDLKLMQSLIRAGTDHSKFMRMINVTMDITAPRYWWSEMDTYKIGTVADSCSTMHTLHKTDLTNYNEIFSIDEDFRDLNVAWDDNYLEEHNEAYETIRDLIHNSIHSVVALNQCYKETGDKRYWRALIQLLPQSFNQKRTWQANYQVLRNIYFTRRAHKLDEWIDFCHMIEELPYSQELICYGINT